MTPSVLEVDRVYARLFGDVRCLERVGILRLEAEWLLAACNSRLSIIDHHKRVELVCQYRQ